MPMLAEKFRVFYLLRLALPLVFFVAFALNAMAMSNAMPFTAPTDSPVVISQMEQHAAHTLADSDYCQQMVQCSAVLEPAKLGELTLSVLKMPRFYMAEYGLGRSIWPPIHPPIV